MRSPSPSVSVIVAAYRSHDTIAGCLEALRAQTFRDVEVVVVDSGPDERGEAIARRFPEVDYHRNPDRLLPHAARNLGVGRSSGSLLVFTDADVYPRPDWLERLIEAHGRIGTPLAGAVACHGRRWLDLGVHLAKFDIWLPGGPPRRVPVGATASFLCPRGLLEEVGGFDGDVMVGDSLLSWKLTERGVPIWLATDAICAHHHLSDLRGLVRERRSRGQEVAQEWARRRGWGRARAAARLAVTVLPLRWAKLMARTARFAAGGGLAAEFLWTSPIVALGHAAWLLGESAALADRMAGRPGRGYFELTGAD